MPELVQAIEDVLDLHTPAPVDSAHVAATIANALSECFDVHEAPHWHMPYCPDGCTIKTVRTWTRTEVIERHDPADIDAASELLSERIARLRQTNHDTED